MVVNVLILDYFSILILPSLSTTLLLYIPAQRYDKSLYLYFVVFLGFGALSCIGNGYQNNCFLELAL